MSDDRYIDKLTMPQSAMDELARAVPDDVVRTIVRDNYRRSAPTPPAPKAVVDSLVSGLRQRPIKIVPKSFTQIQDLCDGNHKKVDSV